MSISLRKAKTIDNRTSVETLLDMAKAKLLKQLCGPHALNAWVYARRAERILPGELLSDISVSALFPLASKFLGDPVNKSTYATAQRALRADYDIFIEALRHIEPTTKELQTYNALCPLS